MRLHFGYPYIVTLRQNVNITINEKRKHSINVSVIITGERCLSNF